MGHNKKGFKQLAINKVNYANLSAKLAFMAYRCLAYYGADCISASVSMGKYPWQSFSCRFYSGNLSSGILGLLRNRKKKLEKQYIKHSEDIVKHILKKWAESLLDVQHDLFPLAIQHLKDKYPEVWNAWFSEENGKEGYKVLRGRLKQGIVTQVRDKIKDELAKYDKFADDEVSRIVNYINDGIRRKVGSENFSHQFLTKQRTNKTYYVEYLKKEGSSQENIPFSNLNSYSKESIEETTKLLNAILVDVGLIREMENLRIAEVVLNKRLEEFRVGLGIIVSDVEFGFEGIKGKCDKCRSWKPFSD